MSVAEFLFLLVFWYMYAALVWLPAAWIILTLLTPRLLLDKYFKEPHFSPTETVMFGKFPGSFARTSVFGWMLIFPKKAKGRQIYNLPLYMPKWYMICLRLFVLAATCS
ncbi:MAG: hypothetical protein P8104_00150, partial [Gammaproteobacteria bacterium]